ncbi:cyclin-dependent protein kinase inhibitor SMR3-like [Mangifera indica]|uniref:cyclin-dependent protein kinase inhibitor SMR3-like n=1 Tax=Mangifera indica TaxID=29780 RepID=UPI001CFAE9E4|nr:cyclin-dependent protein kinase inhibitor SMR3-like [Mangifera indica]
MGVSNSGGLHQDHDCHNNMSTLQDSELCEEKRVVDLHGKDEAKEEKDKAGKFKGFASSLKIQLPSFGEFKVEEEQEEEGFKTPTSLDHKIPVILQCPPAPRKLKSRPLPKRKLTHPRRIFDDLSNETEALFPPAIRADLGKKIKKPKQETHAN